MTRSIPYDTSVDYQNAIRAILTFVEGNILTPYYDNATNSTPGGVPSPQSNATIGLGININPKSTDNFGIVAGLLGIGTSGDLADQQHDQQYFNQLQEVLRTPPGGITTAAAGAGAGIVLNSNAALRVAMNAIMAARYDDPQFSDAMRSSLPKTFALTPGQSQVAFTKILNIADPKLTAQLNKLAGGNVPPSSERAALMSLYWNSPALIGTQLHHALADALAQGDRAEAWYEIRYNSNGSPPKQVQGVANRRYYESEKFDLYNSGAGSSDPGGQTVDGHYVTVADAHQIYQMVTANLSTITSYDNNFFNKATKYSPDIESLNKSLEPAADYLTQTFAGQINVTNTANPKGDAKTESLQENIVSPAGNFTGVFTPASPNPGNYMILGGSSSGTSTQTLTGLSGRDNVIVGIGSGDSLVGGDHTNILVATTLGTTSGGGSGTDVLVAGPQNNIMMADGISTTFNITSANPNTTDVIWDNGPNDLISIAAKANIFEVNLPNATEQEISKLDISSMVSTLVKASDLTGERIHVTPFPIDLRYSGEPSVGSVVIINPQATTELSADGSGGRQPIGGATAMGGRQSIRRPSLRGA